MRGCPDDVLRHLRQRDIKPVGVAHDKRECLLLDRGGLGADRRARARTMAARQRAPDDPLVELRRTPYLFVTRRPAVASNVRMSMKRGAIVVPPLEASWLSDQEMAARTWPPRPPSARRWTSRASSALCSSAPTARSRRLRGVRRQEERLMTEVSETHRPETHVPPPPRLVLAGVWGLSPSQTRWVQSRAGRWGRRGVAVRVCVWCRKGNGEERERGERGVVLDLRTHAPGGTASAPSSLFCRLAKSNACNPRDTPAR